MKRAHTFWMNIALLAVLLVFGAPFLWLAAMAFDSGTGATGPWPPDTTLANLRLLFTELEVGRSLANSLIAGTAVALLSTVMAALTGAGLSRAAWRGKNAFSYGLLLLYSFPFVATMTPVNDLARRLELFNTYQGLILAQTAVALPLAIWIVKGAVDAVPAAVQEAAEVDGATETRAWLGVVLPSARPALAVAFGLSFALAWSDVLLATALIRGQSMATISLRFASGAQGGLDAPVVAALGLVYLAPPLAIFLVLRRQMLHNFERV